MNQVLEEMYAILNADDPFLAHIGVKRRSGRYPWGSGKEPYQHSEDFLSRVEQLRKDNVTYYDEETGKTYSGDTAIAKTLGLTSSQFRTQVGLASGERKLNQYNTIKRLKEKEGLGWTEIGRKMELSESTVRSLYDNGVTDRMQQAKKTADSIREHVDKYGPTDVGKGVELELRISKERMKQALHILEMEGYELYGGGIKQINTRGQQSNQMVICPPGTPHKDIFDFENVHSMTDYISRDGGETLVKKFEYPSSMDSKRLMVRYAEDGGVEKDGIIELRRGVQDLSLGESRYSQVRILVDGTHYLKGMAVYSDDMPDGVDVIFNTNKKQGTPALGPKDNTVLKPIHKDPDNPFGSLIKDADQGGQYKYIDKDGNEKLGLINKRADEGDWSEWKDALPSQFLSKQSLSMAKKQLNLAKADKAAEFEEICALDNPTIKKHFLQKFADECDSSAVHLQAAALPGQKYHVIIPITSMKDNEVYAPNYENGSKVALIRYPHGGTFEIPILTVNNKQATARKLLGPQVGDAVGINSKVAERLSGADFDGDTVMVIPTHDPYGKVKITSTDPLKGLEGFDPKMEYPKREGMRYMKDPVTGKDATQMEMGKISNLITDMTLAGADKDELAKAVRHSMVVIDAGKHQLDYKKSEIDNDIESLRIKYQGKKTGGAATIISKASGEYSVLKRQGNPKINLKDKEWYDPDKPEGSLLYKTSDKAYYADRSYDKETKTVTLKTVDGKKISYNMNDKEAREKYTPVRKVDNNGQIYFTDKTGTIFYKVRKSMQPSTKMAETNDAYSLVSEARHPMEIVYADHANYMKSLANQARKEYATTGNLKYNSAAKDEYRAEVASLNDKLKDAMMNAPRERAAQRMANIELKKKIEADPTMKKSDQKKIGQQALTKYRQEVGAITRKDRNIKITDREWEAIQKGAISESTLQKILNNADTDILRERATPRTTNNVSTAQASRIKALASSNYTLEEIAKKSGFSASTVSKILKGVN